MFSYNQALKLKIKKQKKTNIFIILQYAYTETIMFLNNSPKIYIF